MVGDGRQARRPALAECGRCGECVLAPAPVLGGGVRQLLVIRETIPVRGGVGQPRQLAGPARARTPGVCLALLRLPVLEGGLDQFSFLLDTRPDFGLLHFASVFSFCATYHPRPYYNHLSGFF